MALLKTLSIISFIKQHWKAIILAFLCFSFFIMMFPVVITRVFLPSSTPFQAEEYQEAQLGSDIDWNWLIVYDTVRTNNNLASVAAYKTPFSFARVSFKEYEKETYYEEVERYDPDTGEYKTVKVKKTRWNLVKSMNGSDFSSIVNIIEYIGFPDSTYNLKLNDAFAFLQASDGTHGDTKYTITARKLDFDEIIAGLDTYQREWAKQLLYDFPRYYSMGTGWSGEYIADWDIELSPSIVNKNIPYYSQHDSRWAKLKYGTLGTISSSGCCPTSFAMVVSGIGNTPSEYDLNNDKLFDPYEASVVAVKKKYRVIGGTKGEFITDVGPTCGVGFTIYKVKEYKTVAKYLQEGKPVIVSVHPGRFTSFGHFMVLVGIDSNGKVILHDPNNLSFTQRRWDFGKEILPEVNRFFVSN